MRDFDVQINVTEKQAEIISFSLEILLRLGLGQIEELNYLIRANIIPNAIENPPPKKLEEIDLYITEIKKILGFSRNSSLGIYNAGVHEYVKSSYEIYKTMRRQMAISKNPNPPFKTVDYDGVITRTTSDPLPVVKVRNSG